MATISGGVGSDSIDGTTAADTLTGSGSGDYIFGDAGNDLIIGDGAGGPTGAFGSFFFEFFNLATRIGSVDDIPASADFTGYVTSIDVDSLSATYGTTGTAANRELYAVRYQGTIEIPTGGSGSYTFTTSSDDGSKLFVNGNEVVDNDGDHGMRTRTGSIPLGEGQHDIRIEFYEAFGGDNLTATISGPATTGAEDIFASGLVGSPDDNTSLGPGDDTLIGGDGDDTIQGNEGDDRLFGDEQSQSGTGLNFEFYNVSNLTTVDSVPTTGAAATGFTNEIDIDALAALYATTFSGSNPEQFAVRYTGEITIVAGGTYDFSVNSDDGSKLFIDGDEVVNNDGVHAPAEVTSGKFLAPGTYDIEFVVFERTGLEVLDVAVSGPDTGNVKIDLISSGLVSSTDPTPPSVSSGNDSLLGGAGSDTFTGGDGNDYFAGFGGGGGIQDEITDFEGIVGATVVDYVDLAPFFTKFSDLEAAATQVGPDLLITLPDGATVLIRNITITDLDPDNTGVPPCFTNGTRLMTPTGECLIEDLRVGDLVVTQDSGPQAIRWTGARSMSPWELNARPEFRPVVIEPDAFEPGYPKRRLSVSPQHRVLLAASPIFPTNGEALVAAKHLINGHSIHQDDALIPVTYHHILFDAHQTVYSERIWTESFHPGDTAISAMDTETRCELLALFPNLVSHGYCESAAQILTGSEARLSKTLTKRKCA